MNIEVRPVHAHEIEAVRQLLSDNGWAHRVESAPWFETLIKNSDLAIVALANGAIVGFARAISDQLSNGYVSMVVVAPGYRRQGDWPRLDGKAARPRPRHDVGASCRSRWCEGVLFKPGLHALS
ncbi:GNAT family N-acetyltransferase [Polaromonas aquatica]|uniref:GNAT family N-acetyltransferase n=1 Tax=Polaromonas aquatica TaxID=332657 RepID=UPI003D64F871